MRSGCGGCSDRGIRGYHYGWLPRGWVCGLPHISHHHRQQRPQVLPLSTTAPQGAACALITKRTIYDARLWLFTVDVVACAFTVDVVACALLNKRSMMRDRSLNAADVAACIVN